MRQTVQSVSRKLQIHFATLIVIVTVALVASCNFDDTPPGGIMGVQFSELTCAEEEASGVFRPECQPSWDTAAPIDQTEAIQEAVAKARLHIDVTNCDIRTTGNVSPFNNNEKWCGGVVFRAGVTYPMPGSTGANATYTGDLNDFRAYPLPQFDPAGDGYDSIFGITLEADNQNTSHAILELPVHAIFGIGPYNRFRRLHIKGPFVPYTNIPYCPPTTHQECASFETEHGVNGQGWEDIVYNEGWKIDNCIIEGVSAYGVHAKYSKGIQIVNSIIRGNGEAALYHELARDMYFARNQVYENGANGIDLGGSTGNNIIEDNIFYNNHWRGWAEYIAIFVGETSDNIIRGNTIFHSGVRRGVGVMVLNGAYNQVLNNNIYGHAGAGIQVGWGAGTYASNTLISGNKLWDNNLNAGRFQIEFLTDDLRGLTSVRENVVTPPGQCIESQAGVTYYNNICQLPYVAVQAESFNSGYEVWPEASGSTKYLAGLGPGRWAKFENLDFGTIGARSVTFKIGVDPAYAERRLEIRLDSENGPLIGKLIPQSTGSWTTFTEQVARIAHTTGIHDVYLVGAGGWGVGAIDEFRFDHSEGPVADGLSNIEGEAFDVVYGGTYALTNAGFEGSNGALGMVGGFAPGSWVKYERVVFNAQPYFLTLKLAVDPCCAGQRLDIRINSPTGHRIGTIYPASTGSWWNFTYQTTEIYMPYPYVGGFDIYFVNAGGWGGANIEEFSFNP